MERQPDASGEETEEGSPPDTSQVPRVAHARAVVILTSKPRGLRRQTQGIDKAQGGGGGCHKAGKVQRQMESGSVWGHLPPGLERLQSATQQPITV